MKKICKLLIAFVLTLCMTVSVLAAPPSPGVEVKPDKGDIELEDGTVITVEDQEALKEYIEANKTTLAEEHKPVKVEGFKEAVVFEVKVNPNVKKAKVTFHVTGVKKGESIIVRVLVNGTWTNVKAIVVEDNKVELEVEESGIIQILKKDDGTDSNVDKPSVDDNNGSGTNGENTSTKAPKTGETPMLPVAYAALGIFGVAAVLAGVKAKKTTK